uniref:Uncharacterized protein n=1 Tax=Lactuca sativa TaxID=4236 RepID=A0A9R1V9Q0_LACSA|nr:hypothetical protein LSAT_V11C600323430 [Lactuca sativa]
MTGSTCSRAGDLELYHERIRGMVTSEDKKTKRYTWGLASLVQGLVTMSRPSNFNKYHDLAKREKSCWEYKEEVPLKSERELQELQAQSKTYGHFNKDFPKLKNQGGKGRTFVIGMGDAQHEPIVVTSMFPINNIYASVCK